MGVDVGDGKIPQVDAIDRDATLVGIVEPGEELDDGGLASTVLAHQRQRLAGLEGKAQVADGPAIGIGIAEADIFEGNALADRRRKRLGTGRRQDGRLDLEEAEQVIQIHRLAGNAGEAEQDLLEQPVEAQKRS